MRYLMVLGILIFAGFFAYDGFVRYPAQNAKIAEVNQAFDTTSDPDAKAKLARQQQELGAPKPEFDITLQKRFAFGLPVIAAGYLIFMLRRSRGEIRLENDTLSVPGYSPIPLSSVTQIDSALWKKKGIAVVHFTDSGKKNSLTLDDFIYQQKPIDAIYDRLNSQVAEAPTPGNAAV